MSTEAQIETLTNLVKRLKYFNDWRRGSDTEQPNPTQIGKDIDAAIEIIKEVIGEAKNGNNTNKDGA